MRSVAWLPFLGLPLLLGLLVRRLPGHAAFLAGDRQQWSAFFRWNTLIEWAGAAVILVCLPAGELHLAPVPAWIWTGLPVSLAGLLFLARRAAPEESSALAGYPLFSPWSWRERVLWLLVYAPSLTFCEEVIFRGGGLALLTPLVGRLPAALIQAVPFAFLHFRARQRFGELLARWAVGAALGLIVATGSSLWAAIALHGALNALAAALPAHRFRQ